MTETPTTVEMCAPAEAHAIGLDAATAVANTLKALADPLRLRLLSAIATAPRGESCVCALAALADVSQPTISQHRKGLEDTGLRASERRGTWVYYRIVATRQAAVTALLDGFASTIVSEPAEDRPESPREVDSHVIDRLAEELADEYDTLRNSEGIKESYDRAGDLDIIVTSAADWTDEHSNFHQYMERSAGCAEMLVKGGCIGDMLWLPVGPHGPLNVQTKIRSMTLIELGELPSFMEKGKHVLLVLGPCAMCRRTKSRVLSAILASEQKLISHLVVDTRSVKEALR